MSDANEFIPPRAVKIDIFLQLTLFHIVVNPEGNAIYY